MVRNVPLFLCLKTLLMRISGLILSAVLLGMVSCGTAPEKKETTKTNETPKMVNKPTESKLNETNTKSMMALLTGYYELKNALVSTDAVKTEAASKTLLTLADSLSASISTDAQNKPLLQPYIDTLVINTKIIAATKDPHCEKQRIAFSPVSDALFHMLKLVNMKNAGIYQQFCPMAFNEKGAHWLSNESEIKNPYYGKKMLECGEVTDSL